MTLQDCEDHLPAAGLDAPPREPVAFRPGIRLPEGDRGPARTVAAGRDPKPEQAARGHGYRTTVIRRGARASTSAAAPSPSPAGRSPRPPKGFGRAAAGRRTGSARVRSESGDPVRRRPEKRVPDFEGEAESRRGPAFRGGHHEHDDRAFGAVHARPRDRKFPLGVPAAAPESLRRASPPRPGYSSAAPAGAGSTPRTRTPAKSRRMDRHTGTSDSGRGGNESLTFPVDRERFPMVAAAWPLRTLGLSAGDTERQPGEERSSSASGH